MFLINFLNLFKLQFNLSFAQKIFILEEFFFKYGTSLLEIFLIPKKNEKLSYSGETRIFHSNSLQTINQQIGLIELVNQEIMKKRWDIRSNPLNFSIHGGEPCWHIRLHGISQDEEE